MKIQSLNLHPFEIPLTTGQMRKGVFIHIQDALGNTGFGEVSPLPKWSFETLDQSIQQIQEKHSDILKIDWTEKNCLSEIAALNLLPSVAFGLESALFSILAPKPPFSVNLSALLMGTVDEILKQSKSRISEGYFSAKLKVSNLTFEDAYFVISELKDQLHLRIDVNRAWNTLESLQFFDQFPLDTFDYVEEPFKNPQDLAQFKHPLAVDESFPTDLSLKQLEELPFLKALIYKPTMQGGMGGCLPLVEWANKRNISLVLSSSFESDLGLSHIAAMAHTLNLETPIGIGTLHYLTKHLCENSLQVKGPSLNVQKQLIPSTYKI